MWNISLIRQKMKYFLQMNNLDVMETSGSISSTPQIQTPHWDESSPNASKQRNERTGSGNSLGISYCCF